MPPTEHDRLRAAAADMGVAAQSLQLLEMSRESRSYFKALAAHELHADAVAVMARLLPKPYAVAWICRCARAEPLGEEDKAAVAVAERWLREPTEENRQRAAAFAAAAKYETVGAWIAAAAGWSGGSLAPAGQPDVAPPPHLTARAVSTALVMLATRTPPLVAAKLNGYLEQAFEFTQVAPRTPPPEVGA